jgi:serine/threonine protein kinase/TPR repeat protein
MANNVIHGPYEVLTREDGSLFELGRGPMGVTYKALDTRSRLPVCLKVINPAFLNSDTARQRFIREAHSAANLRHRNVASVYPLVTEGDTWLYAMEFVDGETLEAVIKRDGALAPTTALEIAAQVAHALDASAQQGLVHRDITPANLILVKENGEVFAKIIDFGLVKTSLDAEEKDAFASSPGGFAGTPHFASPEQFQGEEIDVRSEMYSLGATLWHMLTGQPPFVESIARVIGQHLSKPPPFEKFDALPPPVASLLRKMLEKDSADRFQTPAELQRAIEEVLGKLGGSSGGEKTAGPLPSPAPPPPKNDKPGIQRVLEDDVQFTIYRPRSMQPLRRHTWLVFAHRDDDKPGEPDYGAEVEEQARAILGAKLSDYAQARQESNAALPRESAITIVPEVQGIEFNPSQRQFVWQEPVHREEFLARASGAAEGRVLRGKITFFLGALIVSEINVKVTVTAGESAEPEVHPMRDRGQVYRRIFASYSRRDKLIVDHFEGIVAAFGDRYLRDVHHLRTGEEWSPGLQRMICEADIFQLFWSSNSMRSPHVRQEWEFALSLGRSNFVRPTYWQEPFPEDETSDLPPPPLRKLHFQHLPSLLESADPVARPLKPHGPTGPEAAPGVARMAPATLLRKKWKSPTVALGAAVAIVALSGGVYFLLDKPAKYTASETHKQPINDRIVFPTAAAKYVSSETDDQRASEPPKLSDAELARQKTDKLEAAFIRVENLEKQGDIRGALESYLKIVKDFPDGGAKPARQHLESLLDGLRQRKPPVTREEFESVRDSVAVAAEMQVLSAMMLLAQRGTPAESYHWYLKAAEEGNPEAMYEVGLRIAKGIPSVVEKDLQGAVYYLKQAAEKNYLPAINALGECYLRGKGVPQDEAKGLKLLRQAAAAKDPSAMNNAAAYLARINDPRPAMERKEDLEEAFKLLSEARDMGNLDALGNLATMYINGYVPGSRGPDLKQGVKLFHEGAVKGNTPCMFGYARCLETGFGVKANRLEAENWYFKAAREGFKPAIDWCGAHHIPLP